MEIESIENGVKITIPKKEMYTLGDLEQQLIKYLIDKLTNHKILFDSDIKIIEILFR